MTRKIFIRGIARLDHLVGVRIEAIEVKREEPELARQLGLRRRSTRIDDNRPAPRLRFLLELRNGLFLAPIEDPEVFLLESFHRMAIGIAHDHAHQDKIALGFELNRGLIRVVSRRSDLRQNVGNRNGTDKRKQKKLTMAESNSTPGHGQHPQPCECIAFNREGRQYRNAASWNLGGVLSMRSWLSTRVTWQ